MKQVELGGKVLRWDLKATFEGNEGKMGAGRERGKNLDVWNYKIATELDLELVKNTGYGWYQADFQELSQTRAFDIL